MQVEDEFSHRRFKADGGARKLRDRSLPGAIVKSSSEAIISTDLNGVITSWNPAAEELFGYVDEEVIGDRITWLIPPDRRHGESEIRDKIRHHEQVEEYETMRTRKDGTQIEVSITASPINDETGKLIGISQIVHEITPTQAAKAKVRLKSADDASGEHTTDGIITSWNRGAEQLFGYKAEEMIGENVSVLFPRNRAAEGDWILERLSRGESIQHYDTIRLKKGGTPVHVSLSVSPIKDAHGQVIGAVKIIRDITQHKLAEEKVLRAKQQLASVKKHVEQRVARRIQPLEEINRSLESLSYSMAHDLRAPIRSIKGFGEILLEESGHGLDQKSKDYVQRIVAAARRAEVLIADLLAYSRVSQAELPSELVNTEDLIGGVLADLREEIEKRKAVIDVRKPLPVVLANPSTLAQVVENLVTNALKYVAKGVIPHLEIYAEPRGNVARFYFRDNGIGIDPKHHQKIFHLFERVESSHDYPGTGVGLAIVQKGMERMGGRVGVESQRGQGSCFWIELRRDHEFFPQY